MRKRPLKASATRAILIVVLLCGVVISAYGFSMYMEGPVVHWTNIADYREDTVPVNSGETFQWELLQMGRRVPYSTNSSIEVSLVVNRGSLDVFVMSGEQYQQWLTNGRLFSGTVVSARDISSFHASFRPTYNTTYYIILNNSGQRVLATIARTLHSTNLDFDYSHAFRYLFVSLIGLLMIVLTFATLKHRGQLHFIQSLHFWMSSPLLPFRRTWVEEIRRLRVREYRRLGGKWDYWFTVALLTIIPAIIPLQLLNAFQSYPQSYQNVLVDYLVRGTLFAFLTASIFIVIWIFAWRFISYRIQDLGLYVEHKLGMFNNFSPKLEEKYTTLAMHQLNKSFLIPVVLLVAPALVIALWGVRIGVVSLLWYFVLYLMIVSAITSAHLIYRIEKKVYPLASPRAVKHHRRRIFASIFVSGVQLPLFLLLLFVYATNVPRLLFAIVRSSIAYRYFADLTTLLPEQTLIRIFRFMPAFVTILFVAFFGFSVMEISLLEERKYKEILTGLSLLGVAGSVSYTISAIVPEVSIELGNAATAYALVFLLGYFVNWAFRKFKEHIV